MFISIHKLKNLARRQIMVQRAIIKAQCHEELGRHSSCMVDRYQSLAIFTNGGRGIGQYNSIRGKEKQELNYNYIERLRSLYY